MKAWQFQGTNEPLVLNEIPAPTPGPGEVLIAVKAAGLSLYEPRALADESWMSLFPELPVTMGHEIAGEVIELGEGVDGWKIGDRVGVHSSGTQTIPGYSRGGGFAPLHVAPAGDLVLMPPGLPYALAALGTDAGMTAYHAMMTVGGVKEGAKVAVIGFGGLGQIGARVAVVTGAEVAVVDVNPEVWAAAEDAGAVEVVADVTELEPDAYDVVVDFAGFGDTTANAVKAIRRDGAVVLVGLGKLEATFNTRDLVEKHARILGASGGTREDMAKVYQLLASGKVQPLTTEITFEEIPEGVGRLGRGEVRGRLVAVYQ